MKSWLLQTAAGLKEFVVLNLGETCEFFYMLMKRGQEEREGDEAGEKAS